MPFSLATFISPHPKLLPSPSPTDAARLYFAPGGHTHDRHIIPPDQLHISLSDPVLVAAEEQLANVQRRNKLSTIVNDSSPANAHLGSIAFHLKGGILSKKSGDDIGSTLAVKPVNGPDHCWKAEFHWDATENPSPPDLPNDACDIVEVMTIASVIDVSPGSDENRHVPHLAPLASETFREELYVRGFLKRPASRPAIVATRKPRASLMSMSRKVFPKVLGRRQGREVAETLRTEQINLGEYRGKPIPDPVRNAVETPDGPQNHTHSVASVTLRAPHAALGSPATDTATSASDSFDLHEFSYLTAFTTPPSSPSIVLDAEAPKQVVDGQHAV